MSETNWNLFAVEDYSRDEIAEMRDCLDNLLIAISMGWDLDGVVESSFAIVNKLEEKDKLARTSCDR